MAEPEALQRWLQTRLERAFPSGGWAVGVVVESLAQQRDAKAVQDTIDSFLGASDETPALVREYFTRRSGSTAAADDDGRPLTAYVKPPAETPAAPAAAPRRPAAQEAAEAAPRGRARKAVAAAAAAAAAVAPDDRSWRGRVVNCLACGCVHDCRGADAGGDAMRAFIASNACVHCGAPVPPDGEGSAASASDVAAALAAARLVEFDRTSAQRSTVVDDQGDYRNDFEGDAWLSASEKKTRRAALAAAEEAAAAERRRVRVTLDLVGRRVLAADGSEGAAPAAIDEAELARRAEAARAAAYAAEATHAEGGGRAAPAARAFAAALDAERIAMAPCPTAPHTPLFRPRAEAKPAGAKAGVAAAAAKKAPPAPRQGAGVPRVQHAPAFEQAAGGAS